jgi:nitrite reductase/ring-hydroxylating ferredoxin subunit
MPDAGTDDEGGGEDGDCTDDGRTRIKVCPADELGPGERTMVEAEGRSIGVFNVDGEYRALNNVCPHQLAPLCEGTITGETVAPAVGEYDYRREGEIIRCPWHGWEFDITTGESLFNPHLSTRTYDVDVESRAGCAGCGEPEAHEPDEGDEDASDATDHVETYGTDLSGDEPPVETYDATVEREVVVVYV